MAREAPGATAHGDGPYQILPGRIHPLGATPDAAGVNFSLYCGQATAVDLLLFDERDGTEPARTIALDPIAHQTFLFWHAYVLGARPGAALRVPGRWPARPARAG